MRNGCLIFFLFLLLCSRGFPQTKTFWNPDEKKVLLLEKIGTRHRFIYEAGDIIKLKTRDRVYYNSFLWDFNDTSLIVGQSRTLPFRHIAVVYPQFQFPKKVGVYTLAFGVVYFGVATVNHLINKEKVFTNDVFIVPAACFGAGFICIALSQRSCPVGVKWKLKILNVKIL
jgi:hypothetical protein